MPGDAAVSDDIQERGLQYWEGISADDNGMLGGIPTVAGFSQISKVDLQGSRNFLAKLGVGAKPGLRVVDYAVEGGAGIGRITRGLLLDVAKQIDVVEPIAKFTEALHGVPGVRDIANVGLEKWHPKPDRRYDLVWVQWCVGHLTDDQLVQLLVRCRDALNPHGLVVIKENLSTTGADVFDEEDSSVTRHDNTFRDIFQKAGFQIKKTELQRGFPSNSEMTLLPVRMYALQPKSTTTDSSTS